MAILIIVITAAAFFMYMGGVFALMKVSGDIDRKEQQQEFENTKKALYKNNKKE